MSGLAVVSHNPDLYAVKQQILGMVKQSIISEQQFSAFNEKIDKKLAERVLQAKDAENQPRLNEIYELYRKTIEAHKINLKIQYDFGQRTFQQIEMIEDLSKIPEILQIFQEAMQPVLEEHKKLEMDIQNFERSIGDLLPENTLFTS